MAPTGACVVTDTRTDEAILEALDFDHEVPCEVPSWHVDHGDGPAVFLVRQDGKRCGHGNGSARFMCAGCWVAAGATGTECVTCGARSKRDEVWRIVRVIGGAR